MILYYFKGYKLKAVEGRNIADSLKDGAQWTWAINIPVPVWAGPTDLIQI